MQIKLFKLLAAILITSLGACSFTANNKTKISHFNVLNAELPNLRGQSINLERYRGNYVLLHFWASWCIPCNYELENLQNLSLRLKGSKITILGVAVKDEWQAVAELLRNKKISFPMLLDQKATLLDNLGIKGLPVTILLDPEGRWVQIPDPKNLAAVFQVIGPRKWDDVRFIERLKDFSTW